MSLYNPISEPQIPRSIARNVEVDAAFIAHLGATHPHSQYLLPIEGDARYRLKSAALFTAVPFPTASVAGNSFAFSWNSVQPGLGIAELCDFRGLGSGGFDFFIMGGNAIQTPSVSHRVARIDASGAYIQTSDKRLKSNFTKSPGLETLMLLEPLRYTHWSCAGFDPKSQLLIKQGKFFTHKLGFLAQDVETILPEAVSVPSSKKEVQGIDYSCLLTCAIQSIQDLKKEIDELKKEIDELRVQHQNSGSTKS